MIKISIKILGGNFDNFILDNSKSDKINEGLYTSFCSRYVSIYSKRKKNTYVEQSETVFERWKNNRKPKPCYPNCGAYPNLYYSKI